MTFNYDRSLEAYLHTALKYRFDLTENQALRELERIPIIHVHGELGSYPDIPYERVHDLRKIEKISQSIQIIQDLSDTIGSFCSPRFEKAHNYINQAARVVFMGFGFHTDNVRRLEIIWSEFKNREVRGTMTMMSPAQIGRTKRQISEFGLTDSVLTVEHDDCNSFFRDLVCVWEEP